jgi:hypothetical protein
VIYFSAEALQSLFFLTTAPDVFARHKLGAKKGLNLTTWNTDQANQVLVAWQRNFSSLVYNATFNQNENVREEYAQIVRMTVANKQVGAVLEITSSGDWT